MDIVSLRWDGAPCLEAARAAMRKRSRIEIALPLETHHALFRHLHPEAPRGPDEDIDASGGAELLATVASVAGLEGIDALSAPLKRARYRAQLVSPEPLLLLLPPDRGR